MPATPAWPPKSTPRLFIEQRLESGATVRIDGNAAHYLLHVMRAKVGDAVMLCDNLTGEWIARITDIAKRDLMLMIDTPSRPRETVPDFWLCCALIKKQRIDWIIEKATELGVAEIRPVITHRTIVDKINLDRWSAQMIEAAEQCGRTALPIAHEPVRLNALLRDWSANRALFFADENGGQDAATVFAAHHGPAALLIGPEGGFDDTERDAIRAHPAAVPITLGPRILRAETAAIAATAVWMAVAGDWA